jgi:hypothetical protein
MKQLFILTVLIICSFAGNGQTSKYSVEVNISTRVDTTYNKDKKEIYHLLKNYLEARPDSFYNNPYWTQKEKDPKDSSVISEFYVGFYSLHLKPQVLFANWKPFILTIEPVSTDKYLLRVALISDTLSADKVLTILNINAVREKNTWLLENNFNDVVSSWKTQQFKHIKYVYPPTYNFNESLAEKSVSFCDSVARLLNINKLDSFNYYICDNPDKMGILFGYEFYNQNYTTGLTRPSKKQIFSAKGNEYYPHEFLHMLLINSFKDTLDYMLQEGLCCFLGENNTLKYEYAFIYLANDYLNNMPSFTFSNLLTNSANSNGYNAAYPTGSLIVEIIFKRKGFNGIKQLLNSKANSEETIYKTVKEITGLNKKQFEQEFIMLLKQHVKW